MREEANNHEAIELQSFRSFVIHRTAYACVFLFRYVFFFFRFFPFFFTWRTRRDLLSYSSLNHQQCVQFHWCLSTCSMRSALLFQNLNFAFFASAARSLPLRMSSLDRWKRALARFYTHTHTHSCRLRRIRCNSIAIATQCMCMKNASHFVYAQNLFKKKETLIRPCNK